jgi:hypothetical protein
VRCRTSRPSYRLSTPTGIGTGTMHPLTTAAAASPYAGIADDARQVLFISMGAGMVAVRPAYAAAGGTISILQNDGGMTFLLGSEECRIQVTITKAGTPAQSESRPVVVARDAGAPLFEHRFYEPSQTCVGATLRVRAFWGYVGVIDESLLSPSQHRWNNPRPAPGVSSHRFGDTGCEIEIQTSKAE